MSFTVGEVKTFSELKALGFPVIRTCRYMWVRCPECGLERWVDYKRSYSIKTERLCKQCNSKNNWRIGTFNRRQLARENNGMWKGGKAYQSRGYIWVRIFPENPFYEMGHSNKSEGRYIPEHRLVMAQFLNRVLKPTEIVHHKNGVKTDNRIENLEITSRVGHITDHSKGYIDGFNKGISDSRQKLFDLEKRVLILEAENIKLISQLEGGVLSQF